MQVGTVQRQFIVKLLGESNFSKHLSAVREINSLLMRALGLRKIDAGNSIKVRCFPGLAEKTETQPR